MVGGGSEVIEVGAWDVSESEIIGDDVDSGGEMLVGPIEVVGVWAFAVVPTEIKAITAKKRIRAPDASRTFKTESRFCFIYTILLPIRLRLTTSCS